MNVYSIEEYKNNNNPDYIKIGDKIEWIDYDGSKNIGIVEKISYERKYQTKENRESALLSFAMDNYFKSLYTIKMTNGVEISATAFNRKIISKSKPFIAGFYKWNK